MGYNIVRDKNNEIMLINNNDKIYLDPKNITDNGYIFISHAHSDHLINKSDFKKYSLKNKILSSQETTIISNLRGYSLDGYMGFHKDCKLLDSGHILGSKGLLVNNDEVFYTGDFSIRNRAFLKKPNIPKVKTLILESTFGIPNYVFPPLEKITHYVNTLISEMYGRGIPVILLGYALGKAQILTSLFGSWKPLITQDGIFKFNKIYQNFKIDLEDSIPLSIAKEKNLLNSKPWTLIYPLTNGNNREIMHLKQKYNAVTVGFSGWAVSSNYKYRMNLDYAIPFSDHCDFNELIQVVKESKASEVYTIHGFTDEFAFYLNSLGYSAYSLNKNKGKNYSKEYQEKNNNVLDVYFN